MNPVAYLLLSLYIDTAEIVSDSIAVDGCTEQKRKDYATLLVLQASTSDVRPVVWKNNLSVHKKKDGKEVKMEVAAGDQVIYSKYAGTEVKLDGEEYIIVKQDDILAICE